MAWEVDDIDATLAELGHLHGIGQAIQPGERQSSS
jgi:hypothetical protein